MRAWGGCRGYIADILETCWDNGKENGNSYLGFRV